MSNDRQSQIDKTANLVGSIFNDTSTPAQSQESISKKEDLFIERLTLPISPAHRDFLDSFINSLKRSEKISTKIINRNSIIRALIDLLIDKNIDLETAPKILTEQELFEWLKK